MGLDAEVTEAVVRTLTAMHETKEGRARMEAFDDTARFDVLSAKAMAPVMGLAERISGPAG